MKKLALMLSLVLAAGVAVAQETKTEAIKAPEKAAAAAKTHDVQAEIVAVDATAKTLTIKGEKENKTVPVDATAMAAVKALKAGDKVTLICRDDEKGAHQAVTGVKTAAVEKK